MLSSWKCYHHMMLPTCAPHEVPDLSSVKNGMIFRAGGTPMLARWTTNFDCGYETDFWYVVKNEPFDIKMLKAKRRYEITKGLRNFGIRLIRATDYAEFLIDVITMATREYPESYRPKVDKEGCLHDFQEWESVQKDTARVYGAFNKNGVLCGFAKINANESYADYRMLKAKPDSERLGINAALTYAILEDLAPRLAHGYYICDGARNVSHETHFQEYLQKYFGFRRAYCNLHIAYRAPLEAIVQMLYPLRRLFSGNSKFGHKVKAVLAMEEMRRNCEKACIEHAKIFGDDGCIS